MESIRGSDGSADASAERSLGDLFRQLSKDLGTLVRQESELARAEVSAKLSAVGKGVAAVGLGAAIAYAGLLFLLLAAAIGLADLVDSRALGALGVGVLATAIGVVLMVRGRDRLKPGEIEPTRTLESLRKDAELARSTADH
jgi:hypothetical protein